MELQPYLDILKRRAVAIAIVAILAVAVVTVVGILTPPIYSAKATVRIFLDVGIADFNLREDYNIRLLNTYKQLAKSRPLLERAIDRMSLGASVNVADLVDQVQSEIIPNTELIAISVDYNNPATARDLANALATLLIEDAQTSYAVNSDKSASQITQAQLASLESQLESDRQQLDSLLVKGLSSAKAEALKNKIQLEEDAYTRLLNRYEDARLYQSLRANSILFIEPASLPVIPSNVLRFQSIALALLMGLFGGLGLALVMENLDRRIHSPQELENLSSLRLLGVVPKGFISPGSLGQFADANNSQPIEEAFRLLSVNLQIQTNAVRPQTILITSAIPKEGKSTVATNLALSLAGLGQTVFLIEGDMRNPALQKMLDLDGCIGLSNLLSKDEAFNGVDLTRLAQPVDQLPLYVICGGPQVANPTQFLASPRMAELLEHLRKQGQMILLDAPPVLQLADVSALVPKVDGAILVVNQAHSNREQVLVAIRQLQAIKANILGFVFVQTNDQNHA